MCIIVLIHYLLEVSFVQSQRTIRNPHIPATHGTGAPHDFKRTTQAW